MNPKSTTPPTRTPYRNSGSTSFSGSGSRGSSGNRGGNNRSRGEQSILAVNSTDKYFKGKIYTIGVLGLPIKGHLKFGLSYEDFKESLTQYAAENLKKGNDLKPLIKFLFHTIYAMIR